MNVCSFTLRRTLRVVPKIGFSFNVKNMSFGVLLMHGKSFSDLPQPQSPEHTMFAFLHLHRRVAQPVVQLHVIISTHALGIGSSVIRTGTSLPSISFQPDSSGLSRICHGQYNAPVATPSLDNGLSLCGTSMRHWLVGVYLEYQP